MSGKRRVGRPRPGDIERRIAEDLEALRLMGAVMTWQYAERVGCAEQTAKNRLRKLHEAGLADRHRERAQIGWTYEAKAS
jgi:predicted transcriptional regulator